jgi:transposase-like protein
MRKDYKPKGVTTQDGKGIFTKKHPKYDEIKERAKELYLSLNENGNFIPKDKIVRKLCEEFDLISMTKRMIEYWNNNENWDDLRQKTRLINLKNVRSTVESKEEKLTNEVQKQIAEIYQQSDKLSKAAAAIVAKAYTENTLGLRDAIRLLKDCTDTKLKLLGIEDRLKVTVIDDRIEKLKNMSDEERDILKKSLIGQLIEMTDKPENLA